MNLAVSLAAAMAVLLILPGAPARRPRSRSGSAVRLMSGPELRAWLMQTMLRRRMRGSRRLRSLRLVDAIVCELRAGLPPRAAILAASSTLVDPLCPRAASAAALGGDVTSALRADAAAAGLPLFAGVSVCWQVSESTGAGLATGLDQLLVTARADEEVRAEVAAQLAAPRATARLLAVLPLFGLMLGASLGVSPLGWLLGSPAGWAVLAAGVGEIALGLWWIRRMVAGIERDLAGHVDGARAR